VDQFASDLVNALLQGFSREIVPKKVKSRAYEIKKGLFQQRKAFFSVKPAKAEPWLVIFLIRD
jgi:hypothetical protein